MPSTFCLAILTALSIQLPADKPPQPCSDLHLTAIDAHTGQPIPGVQVSTVPPMPWGACLPVTRAGGVILGPWWTDEHGRADLVGVLCPGERMRIVANHADYQPEAFPFVPLDRPLDRFETLLLVPGHTVRGRLVDGFGVAKVGVPVECKITLPGPEGERPRVARSSNTAPDGSFSLTGLPEGVDLHLLLDKVRCPAFCGNYRPPQPYPSYEIGLRFRLPRNADLGELPPLERFTVRGRVLDAAGEPVWGRRGFLAQPGCPDVAISGSANLEGRIELSGAYRDAWRIGVADDFGSAWRRVDVPAAKHEPFDIRLPGPMWTRPQRQGPFDVIVRPMDGDGDHLGDLAVITVETDPAAEAGVRFRAELPIDGDFAVTLPPGTHTIRLCAGDWSVQGEVVVDGRKQPPIVVLRSAPQALQDRAGH